MSESGSEYDGETDEEPEWVWCRFYTRSEDYRPVKFPPPGPYWCSGCGHDYNVIVAYFPFGQEHLIEEYWPDAYNLNTEPVSSIEFRARENNEFFKLYV